MYSSMEEKNLILSVWMNDKLKSESEENMNDISRVCLGHVR